MLKRIELGMLLRGKLVMVALPGSADWASASRRLGAKDVLLLTRSGPNEATRHPTHVAKRYARLRDVNLSNSEVGILNGAAALAIFQKDDFWKGRFEKILVPLSATLLVTIPSIIYYAQRRRFIVEGVASVDLEGRARRYLVIGVRKKSPHNRRLFAPSHLSITDFLQRLHGLNYVLLRKVEAVEDNGANKDVDLLVSDADLTQLRERFRQEAATLPIEVYTETGADGHDYRTAPYFIPEMARRMLADAEVRPSGIRALSPKWQYLSLSYHLVFHYKSQRVAPGTVEISPITWDMPCCYHSLIRAARAAGFSEPKTFDDLDKALRADHAFPGRDLIGFYARGNPFVTARYIYSSHFRAGLATFFLRDFGDGNKSLSLVLAQLEKQFNIIAHGPVNGVNRDSIVSMIRGGNWLDPERGTMAEPSHWFVCWDKNPIAPRGRARKKYPNLDNQRIVEFKLRMREEAAQLVGRPTRLLHASDNTNEAIEHVHAIGLAHDPQVLATIERLKADTAA